MNRDESNKFNGFSRRKRCLAANCTMIATTIWLGLQIDQLDLHETFSLKMSRPYAVGWKES
jgi:hypothetical protein